MASAGPISARASDGYGGTADCSLRVTVELPPPPPEPVVLTFMCSEFASGRDRIDNRCKAVLDDVALQLRQNPGATAAITGTTIIVDGGQTLPEGADFRINPD